AGQGNRRPGLAAAIRLVADDGMAPRCQMDANLMRPTGLQPALDVRERAKSLANPEPGDRAPSRTVPSDGHALAMVGITTDGRVDSPSAGGEASMHDREVLARHLARRELRDERMVRGRRLRDDEKARGSLVEPVDDAGTARSADAGGLGRVREHRGRERA